MLQAGPVFRGTHWGCPIKDRVEWLLAVLPACTASKCPLGQSPQATPSGGDCGQRVGNAGGIV